MVSVAVGRTADMDNVLKNLGLVCAVALEAHMLAKNGKRKHKDVQAVDTALRTIHSAMV